MKRPVDGGAVLVTGASSGIGKTCALRLDSLNYRVLAGVRKQKDGEALKREASESLMPISLDVVDDASIISVVDTLTRIVGEAGLHGLVNNAGIMVQGPLEFISKSSFKQQLEVNVVGVVAVTQALLPLLRQGNGRIVNIGSINGRIASPLKGPYCASKFALEALTDTLRMELRPWNISVSMVEPGSVATPMWEKTMAAEDELLRHLSPEGHDLYGQAITHRRRFTRNQAQNALSANRVADAVVHALTSKRPKTRYVIGTRTRLQGLLRRFIPDRALDMLIELQRSRLPDTN